MKNKILLTLLSFIFLWGCKSRPMHVAKVELLKSISVNSSTEEDPLIQKTIAPYKAKLDENMNKKIAIAQVDLTKEGNNSNLGNLLADFTFEGANEWSSKNLNTRIDAALINIGGIRTSIGKGAILLKHIFEVMPFENEVVIMKMKGKDLQGLFDYYAKEEKNNPVSGLFIETQKGKITKALIGGKPVDDNKIYYIATSDYLALGGDQMDFFSKGEMIPTGIKLRDLFIEYFEKYKEINPKKDVRLHFLDQK